MANDILRFRIVEDDAIRIRGPETIEPRPDYEGPFEVTPSNEEQVLPTAGTLLRQDVVVAPIPTNYGLITYNGSSIRVS